MDELYGNAWGDSSSLADELQLPQPTWTSTKLAVHDDEADLAAPSWSTGADIRWNEPSQDSHGFNWAANEPDLAWAPESVYHDIQIQKTVSSEPEPEDEVSLPTSIESETEDEKQDEPLSLGLISVDDSRLTSPANDDPSTARSFTPPSRSPSPDGFGTFETGADEIANPFSATLSGEIADEDWSSPWVGTAATEEESEEHEEDEWEAARRQKEQLDRKISPEVLASIMAECAGFFEGSAPAEPDAENGGDPWFKQWRDGMDVVEGLDTLMQTVVPDLTLQPPAQFTSTSIAKSMATTIRLTKNLPLAKNSPFSLYLATKGSTAWETAVKQRKVGMEEDVIPAGWRILEKQPAADTTEASKETRQSGGGIFSFWGRRHAKAVSVSSDKTEQAAPAPVRSPSVPRASDPSAGDGDAARRDSQDSVASNNPVKDSPGPSAMAVESLPTPVTPPVPSPVITASSSSYADVSEPHLDSPQSDSPQQPPSAVSRFLTRFSRKRSSLSASSPRSSLALSSDDLDVLSDIVPSAQDGPDDDGIDIMRGSFSDALTVEPLPPALPPPPASTKTLPSRINVHALVDDIAGSSSSKSSSTVHPPTGDLEDFFGAFESHSAPIQSHATPLSAAPLVAAPLTAIGDRSRTLTPVSLLPPSGTPRSGTPSSLASVEVPVKVPSPVAASSTPPIRATTPSAQPAPEPSFDLSGLMSSYRKQQPKTSVPFSLPPPPSSASIPTPLSSASSSGGDVPLAQLYPTGRRSADVSADGVRTPSPFVLDPVRTRNHTPIMVSIPPKPSGPAPLLPPPPSFASRTTVATPATNLFGDDDDDFADFQSSTQATPVTQASTATSTGVLPLPPPGRHTIPNVSLPSAMQAATPLSSIPHTPQPLSADPFHDEFSAFFSPSSTTNFKSHSSSTSFGYDTSFSSGKSLFKDQADHTEFDDFVSTPASSALRTPSPPKPPTKGARAKPSLSLPRIALDPLPQLSREEKKNQHQRTLSLMERAAARPGQWPAPPSPLPQALAFPISGNAKPSGDFMGDEVDDSFGTFHSDTPAPSAALPSFLAPPTPPQQVPRMPFGNASTKLAVTMQPVQSFSVAKTNSGAGLSAQDLSFFEGL